MDAGKVSDVRIRHGMLHQAENQALRGENQVPWRRGLLGWLIPSVTLLGAAALALYVWLAG